MLAGGTGDLGGRIARELMSRGVATRALVRREADATSLRHLGVDVAPVDFADVGVMTAACRGATCVVSALNGLDDIILGVQSRLLEAAIAAGVPRFIPSDFSLDFTRTQPGGNRNLDLRRTFMHRIDAAPIAATSILNGAFADLLTGQAPIVLRGPRIVLHWGRADQPLDFTTKDDVAAYTARVAADTVTPRVLRIAGDAVTPRSLAILMTDLTGRRHRPVRAGGIRLLGGLIGVTRVLAPQTGAVFPAWQGMQYLRDMMSGCGKLDPLDNARYSGLRWTSARDVLSTMTV